MSMDNALDRLKWHEGPYRAYAVRYQVEAFNARHKDASTLHGFIVDLIPVLADERMLRAALDYMEHSGGGAPGPDGLRMRDLSEPAKWQLARDVRDEILQGSYDPAPPRECRVPKRPGSSLTRSIWVSNLRDRMVARAAEVLLQPLIEPEGDHWSFCRRLRGRRLALAEVERLVTSQRRHVVISEDLKDAFDNVPRARLMQILRKKVPNDRLCDLIERLVRRPGGLGILQGSALSPQMLNVYVDQAVHRPWRRLHGDVPLVRYMDDFLAICREEDHIATLYEDLSRLFRNAGFQAKYGREHAVRDLRRQSLEWLGYALRLGDEGLVVTSSYFCPETPDQATQNHQHLVADFAELHEQPQGWLRAAASARNKLAEMAPTLPFVDAKRIVDELVMAAATARFDLDAEGLLSDWRAAYLKWQDTKANLDRELSRALCGAPNRVSTMDTDWTGECPFQWDPVRSRRTSQGVIRNRRPARALR